ncbi:hypothetical protein Q2406_11525 [Klebsiella pneumoniae]|nr:hypothetical protein [Klebsiella pneumoniae]
MLFCFSPVRAAGGVVGFLALGGRGAAGRRTGGENGRRGREAGTKVGGSRGHRKEVEVREGGDGGVEEGGEPAGEGSPPPCFADANAPSMVLVGNAKLSATVCRPPATLAPQ